MFVPVNGAAVVTSQADKNISVERTNHVYVEASDNFQKKNTFRKAGFATLRFCEMDSSFENRTSNTDINHGLKFTVLVRKFLLYIYFFL